MHIVFYIFVNYMTFLSIEFILLELGYIQAL